MTTQLFRPALAGMPSIVSAVLGAAALVPAMVAAAIDARSHRVPDPLVTLAFVPVVFAVLLAGDQAAALSAVVLGAGLMALPLLLVHLAAPAAMGFGDVKLAAVLGAVLGVLAPVLAVPALAAAAGLTLLASLWKRRSAMPFAPGLVMGAAGALMLGAFEGWRVAA